MWLAALGVAGTGCAGKGAATSQAGSSDPTAAASAPGATADQAAPPGAAAGGAQGAARGRRFGQILKSLNLTPEQTEKIRQIIADARKKSEGADRDTRRANMRAAYQQIETEVLTPAQKAEFDKKMAAMRSASAQPSPGAQ